MNDALFRPVTIDLVSGIKIGARISEASPLKVMSRINVPVMFIHGDKDTLVLLYMMEQLYVSCRGPKTKLVVKLELSGSITIDDSYADLYTNQIIIKGNKCDDFEKNSNKKDENEEIKILKNTRKYGKFNLIIHYGNEIKLADEEPIDDEEKKERSEEGIKIIKFKLAKRRTNRK